MRVESRLPRGERRNGAFFAGVLGYKAGSGEEIARSLRALDNRRWQTALEPVYVIPRSRKVFDVVVPENEIEGDFGLSVVSRQTGEKSEVSFVVVTLPERRTVGKKRTAGWKLRLPPTWRSVITTPN